MRVEMGMSCRALTLTLRLRLTTDDFDSDSDSDSHSAHCTRELSPERISSFLLICCRGQW